MEINTEIIPEISTLKELLNNYPFKHIADEVVISQMALADCDNLDELHYALEKELIRIRSIREIEKLRLDLTPKII